MTHSRTRRPLIVAFAAILSLPVIGATAGDAEADRVRVRVRGEARVRVRAPRVRFRSPRVRYRPRVRVRYRPRVRVRYRPRYWSVGGGYYYGSAVYRYSAPPPPPPPRCYSCGPRVYTTAPVVTRPAPLPRLGIGVFAGSMDVEGHEAGEDLGLLGRFRLTDHWEIEAEVAKSELSDSTRVDRRIGGALMYDFNPRARWSIYALGGLGVSQTDLGGGEFSAEQGYGELGLGLTWRLSRNLALSADIRAGTRETAGEDIALRTVEPVAVRDEENYTRARLSAILYF